MLLFRRNVEFELKSWKASPLRKPLLVYGARQVGKSSVIKRFGDSDYASVVEINFMRDEDADVIFSNGISAAKIIENIQLYTGKRFSPEKDLLVFEEIGFSEKALTSLKFFAEEAPEVHIVATGSNIGLYRSFPVGKVDWLTMYPMTFAEFVEATGNEMFCCYLESISDENLPEIAHQRLLDLMTDYWFVGGMPEAVNAWMAFPETQPLQRIKAVEKVKNNLIKGYQNDFGKLSKDHEVSTLKLQRIYSSLARQIASVEDGNAPKFKFKGTLGNTSVNYDALVEPVDFLRDLMLVHKIFILEGINQQFNMDFQADEKRFKLIPHDIGILSSMIKMQYQSIKAGKDVYKGFLAEVFVANEVISAMQNTDRIELFSFRRGYTLELELLFETLDGFIPIEVKSGRATRSKSLTQFVEYYSPDKAFKLTAKNVNNNPGRVIQHLPLYLARALYQEYLSH